ncbi:hypothetical protein J2X16_005192, partial [Pelomonas aquatica]|nr:hypothetical protein [Pelomonas aquatica]
MTSLRSLRRRQMLAAAALPLVAPMTLAAPAAPTQRRIVLDLAEARQPLDRFFDHCVGADYPGTTYREDALAQLKTTVD